METIQEQIEGDLLADVLGVGEQHWVVVNTASGMFQAGCWSPTRETFLEEREFHDYETASIWMTERVVEEYRDETGYGTTEEPSGYVPVRVTWDNNGLTYSKTCRYPSASEEEAVIEMLRNLEHDPYYHGNNSQIHKIEILQHNGF